MDLPSAVTLRELGFSPVYPDLSRILEDKAETALLESTFTYYSCKFDPSARHTKSTFLAIPSCDGKFLASAHGNHTVYVTEITTGNVIHTLKGHSRTPWALSCHPTKPDLLASGCLAGEIRVWDLNTGCCETLVVDKGESAVASLAFHPWGRLVVIAVSNKLLFWDWHDPEPWGETSAGPTERVRYVKFDQSGSVLYTGITNIQDNSRSNRYLAPPDIIPYRCHELLSSRRQLLEMRSELSTRHRQLLRRYRDLLVRYNELQRRYPYITPTEPPSDEIQQDLAAVDSNNDSNFYDIFEPRAVSPPPLPVAASASVSAPAESDSSLDRPPLSPVHLEGLRDAVGYAHQLTQTSMQQFLEYHQMSMERLQRSYMDLSQSAQRLVRNFQRTYEDMCRLQEQIDQRLGLPTPETGQASASALLRALTRMQQVLLFNANSDEDAEGEHQRPVLRETNTLIEVFDTLLSEEPHRFPQETSDDLQASRQRLVEIRTRIENSADDDDVFRENIDQLLAQEIHGFRGIIRRWKAAVLGRIRERYGTTSTEREDDDDEEERQENGHSGDSGGRSEGFIRLTLSPSSAANEHSSGDGDTAVAAVVPSSSTTQARRIGNVTVSPLKRGSATVTLSSSSQSTGASSSGNNNGIQGGVSINLSPSRVTRVSSPSPHVTTLRYQYPFAGENSAEGQNRTAGGESDGNPIASKRRRLTFASGQEESSSNSSGGNTVDSSAGASNNGAGELSPRFRNRPTRLWRPDFAMGTGGNEDNIEERMRQENVSARSILMRRIADGRFSARRVSARRNYRTLYEGAYGNQGTEENVDSAGGGEVERNSTSNEASEGAGENNRNEDIFGEDIYDLHRSINRAIAGAFIGSGDIAMANNILDLTCRIQEWKFSSGKGSLPELKENEKNLIVKRCKLHNDGSVSLSRDGQILACFVESLASENAVWADTVLNIVSLRRYDKGTVLYQLAFGPNAISVCLSPTDSHVLIGLATRRYLRLRQSPDTFAQVYQLTGLDSSEEERKLKLMLNLNRVIALSGENDDFASYVAARGCTLNCAGWLPHPGQGFAYGTNRGHLYVITPVAGVDHRSSAEVDDEEEMVNTQNIQL